MTTNKNTSHANCHHENTKSARAKCRKQRAAWAIEDAKWEAEQAEWKLDQAAEEAWNKAFPRYAEAHQASAHQNADDTATEEGFEPYSRRWYECALSTLDNARDNAVRCDDLRDPEPGSSIYRNRQYYWVDTLVWGEGWPVEVVLVDDLGNRTTHKVADLVAEREAEEAALLADEA